ncbi:MAG: ABC transporter ATP-binding protein [Thermoguttaceae bacterium]
MPATDNPVLEIAGFSFRIGTRQILRDVSFTVRKGEYLSIVGPNGAGKTTLLKCLDRIYRGGTGRIAVFGRPLLSYSQRDLARRLSYVPQADGRVFPFTVEQFVLMGRYPYLNPFSSVGREDLQTVRRVMQRTGVDEFAHRTLDTLSGGERQKVYIAAALAQGAEVLLLDEPTTFLDYRHQSEVRDLLTEINRSSAVTVVAVTHDVNRAAIDSHRMVALCDGEVVFDGPPVEIMRPEVLERIYGTSFLLVGHPNGDVPIIAPQRPREAGR